MDIVEHVARAIYTEPTKFDGDVVGTHLSHSMMIEASTTTAEDNRAMVMGVCRDAARAAIRATLCYYMENVSDGMAAEGVGERGSDGSVADIFRVMASQALAELDA